MVERSQITRCLDYVLDVLLGKTRSAFSTKRYIAYCEPRAQMKNDVLLCIVPSGFFGEDYGKAQSLPAVPLRKIEGIPLLYGTPEIQRSGRLLIIHADIIASAYFLMTRYEEMVRRDVRDQLGRFPGRESLPHRAGFIHRPVVDEYAALLRKWLRAVGLDVLEPDRRFRVLLTHDVDMMRKYWRNLNPTRIRHVLTSMLRGEQSPWDKWDILESLAVRLRLRRDPFDTFNEMIRIDSYLQSHAKSLPVECMYFFMAQTRRVFGDTYCIRSKKTRSLIHRLMDSGAAIGLHTSSRAGVNPALIADEKAALEEATGFPVNCNRHHTLGWREIEDGWTMARAGINWDSTLGYADVAGFRLGVCRPIPLFDPIKMQSFGIEEHPLVAMDCTFSYDNYMNLNEDGAFDYCKVLINQTRKHNGEFVMLWHNTIIAPERGNYHPRLYQRLLRELISDNEKNK